MPNCKNCNTEVDHNYCSNCGQAVILKRIDGHYITHEIEHVLHFERGIFYTIKGLLIKPGESVRYFISDNRSLLVKPVIFITITSLIYSIVNHFFHIEEGYVQVKELKQSAVGAIFSWVQSHYGYSNIIMGVFIAFWAKIFFRKYNYNFFEILILLCFTMGMGMLIYAVFAAIQGITHIHVMEFGGYVGLIYCTWAIGQFFDKNKPGSYLIALSSYLLGCLTCLVLAIGIGVAVDIFIKH